MKAEQKVVPPYFLQVSEHKQSNVNYHMVIKPSSVETFSQISLQKGFDRSITSGSSNPLLEPSNAGCAAYPQSMAQDLASHNHEMLVSTLPAIESPIVPTRTQAILKMMESICIPQDDLSAHDF